MKTPTLAVKIFRFWNLIETYLLGYTAIELHE